MYKNNIKKILISSFLATSLCASNVSISTDNTGDFLTAPMYMAKGDICSEVKVMNTNEYSSILAKVAIREKISSHEVDLPILLSPGDIWSGTICQNQKGRVILQSDDDSNYPDAKHILHNGIDLLEHAMITGYRENDYNKGYVELNGKGFKLEEIQKTNLDFTNGYVEVYPIAEYNEGTKQKIDKKLLALRWNRLIDSDTSDSKLRKNGVDEDSLSGVVSFRTKGQETSSMDMIAFKNVHNTQVLGEPINFTSDSNPDMLIGKDSKIQILKLLQHRDLYFSYDNQGIDQYLYVTFPFGYKEKQSRRFKLVIRNMKEEKSVSVFSPRFIMKNEQASISIENLISQTNNKMKFTKGIIKIEDIRNNDNAQLGNNQIASILPIKARISKIGSQDILIDSRRVPLK